MAKTQKNYTKAQKQQFLETFRKKDGHVQKACDAFGISRQTFNVWKTKEEWFKKAIEEIYEIEKDDAEELSRMMRKGVPQYRKNDKGDVILDKKGKPIIDGWLVKPDGKMVRHFLDTKAKDRGYGKTVDNNHFFPEMPDNVQIGLKIHKKKK